MSRWREKINSSVLAVPPLARRDDFTISESENIRLIRHLTGGGVKTLLFGGNANFYHVGVSEYADLLEFLRKAVPEGVWVIPSVGPSFGKMMEQGEIARDLKFETVMVLPSTFPITRLGVEIGIRNFFEKWELPVILYLKSENYLDVDQVGSLMDEGVVSAVKYAIVREETSQDQYLRELVRRVDPKRVISGIGEQPAVCHMREFGLGGFTSGCVCIAPGKSMQQLRALQEGEYGEAEDIRRRFKPLEDLRNAHGPIPVLHEAVRLAGIADTGPIFPLMTNLEERHHERVREAALELRRYEGSE